MLSTESTRLSASGTGFYFTSWSTAMRTTESSTLGNIFTSRVTTFFTSAMGRTILSTWETQVFWNDQIPNRTYHNPRLRAMLVHMGILQRLPTLAPVLDFGPDIVVLGTWTLRCPFWTGDCIFSSWSKASVTEDAVSFLEGVLEEEQLTAGWASGEMTSPCSCDESWIIVVLGVCALFTAASTKVPNKSSLGFNSTVSALWMEKVGSSLTMDWVAFMALIDRPTVKIWLASWSQVCERASERGKDRLRYKVEVKKERMAVFSVFSEWRCSRGSFVKLSEVSRHIRIESTWRSFEPNSGGGLWKTLILRNEVFKSLQASSGLCLLVSRARPTLTQFMTATGRKTLK